MLKTLAIVLFIYLLFFNTASTNAQIKNPYSKSLKVKDYSEVIRSLDSLINEKLIEYKILGASIALVDDQSVIWAKGFGYTDISKKYRVNEKTLFSTQSISKTYTTTAFLMEVQKGNFKLDDRIIKYYPSFTMQSRYGVNEAKKITFRHLLSHRAGLCQEAPTGSNYDTLHTTFQKHIKSIENSWLRHRVGEFYSYSNMGPDITGYILSKQARLTLEEYLKQKVLDPLGMTNSTYDQEVAYKYGNLAKGYYGDKELKRTYIADPAGGGLYSNVTDMAKFLMFQFNACKINSKLLISPQLRAEMQTVQFKMKDQLAGYGLGIMIKPYRGGTLMYHPGGGYGYRAEQTWIPEAKIGVIILTNDGLGSPFTDEINEEALKSLLGAKFGTLPKTSIILAKKPVIKLSQAYLQKLIGTYKGDRSILSIVMSNNKLAMVSGSDTGLIISHSKAEFSTKNGNKLIFSFNRTGRPTHFINLNQNHADFYIYNDSPDEKAGRFKPSWNNLLGTYKGHVNRQEQTIKLFKKNGYLYCSAGGETKVKEYVPGVFFTSDGESIIKKGNVLYLGNRAFKSE